MHLMTPPYRADQVGSLLRPAALAAARRQWKQGALEAGKLKETEDRAILEAVRRQEAIGLQAVTDGEFRRDWWHLDFLSHLEGGTTKENPGPKFGGTEEQPPIATVTGKDGGSGPIVTEHFAYLKQVAKATPKFTLPSPSMLHLRGGRHAISREAYPGLDAFWDHVAAAYRKASAH